MKLINTVFRRLIVIATLCCSAWVFPGTVIAAESDYYTVGIVPQQSATRLLRTWTPLLECLSRRSGLKLRFKTAIDINTFESQLFTGEYDFAYMNPYHYVIFNQRAGYNAIARERDKSIQGILVVHKDSPISSINDLEGKTLAFPSPAAFAASILPRAELRQLGIHFDKQFVGSHDSVYHVVARNRYAAGGGIVRTFKAINPGIRDQLRILWSSGKYTPHAFAAHERVPPGIVKRIQDAMLEFGKDAESRAYLDDLYLNGFVKAADSDWQDIRDLGIHDLN